MRSGRTAAGTAAFPLSSNTWTHASNLTSVADWSSLSFFTVDSVAEYNTVPGTAGGNASPAASYGMIGAMMGAVGVAIIVAVAVFAWRLRRGRNADRLAAAAIEAAKVPVAGGSPAQATAVAI